MYIIIIIIIIIIKEARLWAQRGTVQRYVLCISSRFAVSPAQHSLMLPSAHLKTRCNTCGATSRSPSSAYRLVTAWLRAHLYRLGLSHTVDSPCETGPQTPEHVLQSYPMHKEATDTAPAPRTSHACRQALGSKGGPGEDNQFHQYHQVRCLHEDNPGTLKKNKKLLHQQFQLWRWAMVLIRQTVGDDANKTNWHRGSFLRSMAFCWCITVWFKKYSLLHSIDRWQFSLCHTRRFVMLTILFDTRFT